MGVEEEEEVGVEGITGTEDMLCGICMSCVMRQRGLEDSTVTTDAALAARYNFDRICHVDH